MKLQRTKNTSRNIVFGVVLKNFQTIVTFVMRTAMIYVLGVEYLGLNGLFVSILQVLNLAELGVSNAIIFCMLKPVAEDDIIKICAIMKLYKKYYRIIGWVVLVAGMVLLPFIPKLISGDVPQDINIYILYILNLGATVISYWFFAYKSSLLSVHQRSDIISKITLVTDSVKYGLQLDALIVFKNYYFYLIALLFSQIVNNAMIAILVNKMFPHCKPEGELCESEIRTINHKVKDFFTAKIGQTVENSVDMIVISGFLGLAVLAIYQNYRYLLAAVMGFISIIFNSCAAGIGNSLVVETKDKNYGDFKTFTLIMAWIVGFCTCCFFCLYQPFMEIWVGKELMLDIWSVILFCMYFFIFEMSHLINVYKDAAGIWHEDRFRPLITAIANLLLNLVLVQSFGINGVLLATVISIFFIGTPWMIYNLFSVLFKRSPWEYILCLVMYFLVTIFTCGVTYYICSMLPISGVIWFVVKIVICCIIPNIIFIICYMKREEFELAKGIIIRMFGKRSIKYYLIKRRGIL